MSKLVLIAFGLTALAPRAARPCSIYPGCVKTFPAGGEVPANLPALTWTYGLGTQVASADELPDPTVVEVLPNGTERPLPITIERDGPLMIRFGQPLVPGATYRVEIVHACSRRLDPDAPLDVHTTVLTAGPEAPLPDSLGAIVVSDAVHGQRTPWTSSGTCIHEADVVTRTLHLEVSDEARPWVRALSFAWSSPTGLGDVDWYQDLTVERAPEDTWQGLIEIDPYHICATDDPGQEDPMPAGTHTVTLDATIPGSAHDIPAASATFDLRCDDGPGGCGAAPTPWGLFGLLLIAIDRRKHRAR